MNKRKFFSIKYQKYILPDNKNFWTIARDEAVYRLDENLSRLPREAVAMRDKKMKCPCLGHMEEREKLEKFLMQFKSKK